MSARFARATLLSAVATVVLWTLKAVVIGTAGGSGRSPLEGPLFLLGLATGVVATVCVGAGLAGRGVIRRVVGAAAALVVVSVVGGVVQSSVAAPGAAWWRGELNLWVVMLLVLVAALVLRRRVRLSVLAAPTIPG